MYLKKGFISILKPLLRLYPDQVRLHYDLQWLHCDLRDHNEGFKAVFDQDEAFIMIA